MGAPATIGEIARVNAAFCRRLYARCVAFNPHWMIVQGSEVAVADQSVADRHRGGLGPVGYVQLH